ncbi:hypothetical protein UT5_04250 [Ferrigenium sp. UT5]
MALDRLSRRFHAGKTAQEMRCTSGNHAGTLGMAESGQTHAYAGAVGINETAATTFIEI